MNKIKNSFLCIIYFCLFSIKSIIGSQTNQSIDSVIKEIKIGTKTANPKNINDQHYYLPSNSYQKISNSEEKQITIDANQNIINSPLDIFKNPNPKNILSLDIILFIIDIIPSETTEILNEWLIIINKLLSYKDLSKTNNIGYTTIKNAIEIEIKKRDESESDDDYEIDDDYDQTTESGAENSNQTNVTQDEIYAPSVNNSPNSNNITTNTAPIIPPSITIDLLEKDRTNQATDLIIEFSSKKDLDELNSRELSLRLKSVDDLLLKNQHLSLEKINQLKKIRKDIYEMQTNRPIVKSVVQNAIQQNSSRFGPINDAISSIASDGGAASPYATPSGSGSSNHFVIVPSKETPALRAPPGSIFRKAIELTGATNSAARGAAQNERS